MDPCSKELAQIAVSPSPAAVPLDFHRVDVKVLRALRVALGDVDMVCEKGAP